MKIYLSPSNQPRNLYAVDGTNEKVQMEELARIVQSKMSLYNVNTMMATLSMNIGKLGRTTEAKNAGCDFYEAYHTNAGGGGSGRGCVVLYNPKFPMAKLFAENMVAELNAITPHGENRGQQVVNGMLAFDGLGYGEIRSPGQFNIPSVIVEFDFHDNPVTARYIINNKNALADAAVRANVRTFGLILKEAPKPQIPSNVDGMLRVIYDGSDGVNVRTSPEFGDNIAQVLMKGGLYTVVGKVGDFYKLKSGLFITTNPKYVEFIDPTSFKPYTVKITTDTLNIREAPTVNSKDVGNVHEGDVYTIVDEKDGWGKLKSGAGWIRLEFAKLM